MGAGMEGWRVGFNHDYIVVQPSKCNEVRNRKGVIRMIAVAFKLGKERRAGMREVRGRGKIMGSVDYRFLCAEGLLTSLKGYESERGEVEAIEWSISSLGLVGQRL